MLFYVAFLALIAKLSWTHRGLFFSIPAGVVAVAILALVLLMSLNRTVKGDTGGPPKRGSDRTATIQRGALFVVGIVIAVALLANLTPPSAATLAAILVAAWVPILESMLRRKRGAAR
jgi:hypothetical protein